VIVLEDVRVRRGGRWIVDGVTLEAVPGRVLAIIGPNGAGKSTLVRLATGELAPDEGRVLLDGAPIGGFDARSLAERRAVLPQSAELAFPFTVRELVMLGIEAGRPGVERAALASLPEAALSRVGLDLYGGRIVPTLSGGERQRAHLARALAQIWMPVLDGRPRLLLLDEPTASLDLKHQIDTLGIARTYARAGGAVVAVLHDLNLASAFADEIAALSNGKLVARGRPADVVTRDLLREVFGVDRPVHAIGGLPYVLPHPE
jgi:iron complex transport system ATP-binding protein